ncbi:hypothetical protein MTR67_019847 [Solanum verrucosum]|uniref:Uncharacterized protein n=1 Tax=Solanum verrucosum TaxID=315347 RepID=A0AAF0QPH0_SOLVR|nr:hypothetical protein MTR67_019847 [Solanum verrucosum]
MFVTLVLSLSYSNNIFYLDSVATQPRELDFSGRVVFTYLGFDENDWLPLPSFYLDGEALAWFNSLFCNMLILDWKHFKVSQSVVLPPSHFPASSALDFAYDTGGNSKVDQVFDKLPATYKNVDALAFMDSPHLGNAKSAQCANEEKIQEVLPSNLTGCASEEKIQEVRNKDFFVPSIPIHQKSESSPSISLHQFSFLNVCTTSITLSFSYCWYLSVGYIGEFEYVDDHRSGKIVVELNGRLNKCGVISPRFDVGVKEIEGWTAILLPSRQFYSVYYLFLCFDVYVLTSTCTSTTSADIMDHEEARRKNVGGKVLGFLMLTRMKTLVLLFVGLL